jgi:tRNA threonylcarbamoyladenosine biosynthesis protein TsaB
MIVLGIETATAVCGAAIVGDGNLIAHHSEEAQYVHSERLLVLIGECYTALEKTSGAPDAIAVSIGPGSFTGLRIGLSVAKGLAYAGNIPLVAVPTLEALAWRVVRDGHAGPDELLMPMIDARRDEVYTAVYRYRADRLVEVVPPAAHHCADCPALVSDIRSAIIIPGDGAEKFGVYLQQSHPGLASRYRILSPEAGSCSAAAVAMLGERSAVNGDFNNTATIEPLYVKEFQTLVNTQHPGVIS